MPSDTERDRIIEAVAREIHRDWRGADSVPLTTATVNTALLGVCPECHSTERREYFETDTQTKFPCNLGRKQQKACGDLGMCRSGCPHSKTVRVTCPNPYHTHREEMMRHGE